MILAYFQIEDQNNEDIEKPPNPALEEIKLIFTKFAWDELEKFEVNFEKITNSAKMTKSKLKKKINKLISDHKLNLNNDISNEININDVLLQIPWNLLHQKIQFLIRNHSYSHIKDSIKIFAERWNKYISK